MCTKYTSEPNNKINDDVREMLNAIAEKNDFKHFDLEINEGISKGDGFTGNANNVRICNSNNRNQTLNFHVKSAFKENDMREILPIAEMFSTEIYMYNTIFPHFKNLEIRNGLTPSTFMPNFFGSISNDKNEVLILEDLKTHGYRMHDCSKPLNSQHLHLIISAYAKYHSLSLALRDKEPELFEKVQPNLNNSYAKLMGGFKDTVVKKYTNILNLLNEADSIKLQSFLQNIDCEFEELLSPSIDEYSVILHGDCWMNNVLFQYTEESCNPIDVCIIDYQLARLAPPILDLAYFFFASSSEEEIYRCQEYLKLYYETLSTHLQKLGCNPDDLYPYSVFMKQWNKFAKFAAIMAPLAFLIMVRTGNEIVDLEESAKKGVSLSEAFYCNTENNEEYNRRVKTIISYLAKNDLLRIEKSN